MSGSFGFPGIGRLVLEGGFLCDNSGVMVSFFGRALQAGGLVVLALGVSCGSPPATPLPAPDLQATVEAAVRAALPTSTPTPAPDIPATVQAGIQATLAARPTATPLPTPTATPEPTATPIPTATPQPTATLPPRPTPTPSIAQMVERVKSGVVRIRTTGGSGSGFVFETNASDRSGLVLTNYHVIEGYTAVDVTVGDTVTYAGRVHGVDPRRDLAVVRICCGNFAKLEFGDAQGLAVGSEVVAVGYPLGLAGAATVTKGIVSANRFDSDYSRWVIQTDASINPGNSGGPLLAADGSVIGINTYKRELSSSGRPVEGVGFAVSEVTVRAQLPTLKSGSYTPTRTTEPRWYDYIHPIRGYGLRVPEGWTLELENDGDLQLQAPRNMATFWVIGPYSEFGTLQEFTDNLLDAARSQSPLVFEPLGFSNVILGPNDHAAIRLEYAWQDSEESCLAKAVTWALLVGNHGYIVEGIVCQGAPAQDWQTLERIARSFVPKQWEEYTEPNHGYALHVPPDWEIRRESTDEVVISSPDGQAIISVVGGYRDYESAEQLASQSLANWRSLSPVVFEAGSVSTAVVGPDAVRAQRQEYQWQSTTEFCIGRGTALFLWIRSRGYIINAVVCEASTSKYQDVIDLILESFNP